MYLVKLVFLLMKEIITITDGHTYKFLLICCTCRTVIDTSSSLQ